MYKATTIGLAIVGAAILFTGARSAGTYTGPVDDLAPRSLRELEAGRLATEGTFDRTDCGPLTVESLAVDRTPVTTRSNVLVMEGVTARRVALPVAGAGAHIGVFSAADAPFDAVLTDARGAVVELQPFTRSADDKSVTPGRDGHGVLLVTAEPVAAGGLYTLEIRQSAGPVDILVKDVSGPELRLSLAEPSYDRAVPVTLRAEIVDRGERVRASVAANLRGQQERGRWRFVETEPGLYEVTIPAGTLNGSTTFVVEARGETGDGMAFQRNGTIGTLVGSAHATVLAARRGETDENDTTVDVDVRVAARGSFHLRANLVDAGGMPVAWAQVAADLTPGVHTMTLRFDNRLVAGRSGLQLTDLMLLNVTTAPGVQAKSRLPLVTAL